MTAWVSDAVFYHIYPLGLTGAPSINDFRSSPANRFKILMNWIGHIHNLGANAVYLSPVFESSSHGYDTADYFTVDRRLGTNGDLREFVDHCHKNGIRVILDAVFNHVGRDHFAFKDLQIKGHSSDYRDWFHVRFDRKSCYGDNFWYEGWSNYFNLVKLNMKNSAVREYLKEALRCWIDWFDIDGIRIDAADCIDKDFFTELRNHSKALKADFWLMGEIIHGDYNQWANSTHLDSVTNYEMYKGLWSSHNDSNYFEIAYSANRQFGDWGIYKNLNLYNFADNHDVNRVASTLKDRDHLFTLYILLFTLPGVPSIYYGSEFGITGEKRNGSDADIRPCLDLSHLSESNRESKLLNTIKMLALIRRKEKALQEGTYAQLLVDHEQYAFMRKEQGSAVIVIVNSSKEPKTVGIPMPSDCGRQFTDLVNRNARFSVESGKLTLQIEPCWGRVLAME